MSPFIDRCSEFICESLKLDLPMRGAISVGNAVLDKDTGIYIGEPIIEAAKLEAAQDWVGLAFGESTMCHEFVEEIQPSGIMLYEPPMKSNSSLCSPKIVLNWPRMWRNQQHDDLEIKLEKLCSSGFEKYYDNAIEFARYSVNHEGWYETSNVEKEVGETS